VHQGRLCGMCRGAKAWTGSGRTSATPIYSAITPGPECSKGAPMIEIESNVTVLRPK
jgi:hypothetical protein